MTVGRLLDEIDAVELSEWQAYFSIVGVPDPWLMTGTVAATMHNAFRTRGRPVSAEDFRPARRERRRQSAAEQMAIMEGIARRMKDH